MRRLRMARMGIPPNTMSLEIGPPRMKIPDIAGGLPRPRPLPPLSAFVRNQALVLVHRLRPPYLPPQGGILVLGRW